MATDSRLIAFYSGNESDHCGRYLHDIQSWTDDRLETTHDYIQWLFPLPEPSQFSAAAPLLTHALIVEFRSRPDLQQNLQASFLRMMEFYGLEVHFEPITVTRLPGLIGNPAGWLSPGNHNHLRITRILRCLNLLGLEIEAKAFFECLSKIWEEERSKRTPAVSGKTFSYWRGAASDTGIE